MKRLVWIILAMLLLTACGQDNENGQEAVYVNISAKEAKERAEEQLRQQQSMQEYYVSKASLARAMARMKAARDRGI